MGRFNPRTRVGCDGLTSEQIRAWFQFQSTHPRGVRLRPAGDGPGRLHVSIHAPAWGATSCPLCGTRPRHSFNPRTRVGCDSCLSSVLVHHVVFQSTHPRGVRLMTAIGIRTWSRFQSTHPRGVRLGPRSQTLWDQRVSIHAPAWGATHDNEQGQQVKGVSIHAPAWGATRPTAPLLVGFWFQSTHPRGVRLFPCFIQ